MALYVGAKDSDFDPKHWSCIQVRIYKFTFSFYIAEQAQYFSLIKGHSRESSIVIS